MRIAVVHSFYSSDQPSGENSVVKAELDALRHAGHDVALFAVHTDDAQGDRFFRLRSAVRVATGQGANPLAALSAFSPDVVHVHNLFPNYGRAWVDHLEAPLVHTLHNYRPLCANGMLLRNGEVCTLCPDGARWAGTRYGCYRGSRLATAPISWANRRGPEADPLLRRANCLIVLSERQRRAYVQAGVPANRLHLAPNFLPTRLDPGSRRTSDQDGWLFVGRLSEEKGILPLMGRWPVGEKLTIVGAGPLAKDVAKKSREIGVTFCGSLPRESVVSLMGKSLGLVFPSMWFEGAPLVYPESLAAGTPVIAFGPSTVADAIVSEETGAIARWSSEGIAAALAAVREDQESFRRRCRRVFEEKYSESSYLERMDALYGSLLTPSLDRLHPVAPAPDSP